VRIVARLFYFMSGLLLILSVYSLLRVARWLASCPVVVLIRVTVALLFIGWLWFRREYYGVRLGMDRTKK
jgi:hypothetical protein